MEVSIDETKVKEWMNEFCSTYDSIGKIRSITTPTGKTASVSGGTYGWSVDEPEEIRKLIENIKSGERVEREPVYEKTVASHSQQDWGDTYVEVDLSTQHMWYIVNGSVQLETDIVTGLASDPNRATPSGVWEHQYLCIKGLVVIKARAVYRETCKNIMDGCNFFHMTFVYKVKR